MDQKLKLENDIEGMLNDFESGITDKDKTIVLICEYVVERAKTAVKNSNRFEQQVRQMSDLSASDEICGKKQYFLNMAKELDLQKWAVLFVIARLEVHGDWDWDKVTDSQFMGIEKQIKNEFEKLKRDSKFSA